MCWVAVGAVGDLEAFVEERVVDVQQFEAAVKAVKVERLSLS